MWYVSWDDNALLAGEVAIVDRLHCLLTYRELGWILCQLALIFIICVTTYINCFVMSSHLKQFIHIYLTLLTSVASERSWRRAQNQSMYRGLLFHYHLFHEMSNNESLTSCDRSPVHHEHGNTVRTLDVSGKWGRCEVLCFDKGWARMSHFEDFPFRKERFLRWSEAYQRISVTANADWTILWSDSPQYCSLTLPYAVSANWARERGVFPPQDSEPQTTPYDTIFFYHMHNSR